MLETLTSQSMRSNNLSWPIIGPAWDALDQCARLNFFIAGKSILGEELAKMQNRHRIAAIGLCPQIALIGPCSEDDDGITGSLSSLQ
jgi:hypothetical protein